MNRPSPLKRSHAITLHFDLNDFSEENQQILSESGSLENFTSIPVFDHVEDDDLFEMEDDIDDINDITEFKSFATFSEENSQEDGDHIDDTHLRNDGNTISNGKKRNSPMRHENTNSVLFGGSSFLFTYKLDEDDVQVNFSRSFSETQDDDVFVFE